VNPDEHLGVLLHRLSRVVGCLAVLTGILVACVLAWVIVALYVSERHLQLCEFVRLA